MIFFFFLVTLITLFGIFLPGFKERKPVYKCNGCLVLQEKQVLKRFVLFCLKPHLCST